MAILDQASNIVSIIHAWFEILWQCQRCLSAARHGHAQNVRLLRLQGPAGHIYHWVQLVQQANFYLGLLHAFGTTAEVKGCFQLSFNHTDQSAEHPLTLT